jgi:hypothetical protein
MTAQALPEPVRERRPTPVFDALLRDVAALGGPAAETNRFKQRCRRMIRYGAGHPAVFARYWARAKALRGCTAAEAVAIVEVWYGTEKRRWRSNDHRLSLMVLSELRLLVRLMRAKRLDLQPVIADVLGEGDDEVSTHTIVVIDSLPRRHAAE